MALGKYEIAKLRSDEIDACYYKNFAIKTKF